MSFKIALPLFSGPLELLLYLIRKNEVSIFEIPLSTVTAQFLEFIRNSQDITNYSHLSDFILMASVLIRMKLRKLLPTNDSQTTEPTVSLFEICEEFERCKKLANILSSLEEERLSLFTRPGWVKVEEEEMNIIDLIQVFHQLSARRKSEAAIFVERPTFRLEDRIADVRERIRQMMIPDDEKENGRHFLTFFTLLKEAKDIKERIIIFFALLELAFLGEVKLVQEREFADIIVIPIRKEVRI